MSDSRARTRTSLCLLLLLLVAQQASAQQQPAAQANAQPSPPQQAGVQQAGAQPAGEVVLPVTVTDAYGRYVKGIGREAFSVREGKDARALSSFREAGDEPLSVLILFDASRSMGDYFEPMKTAAARLVAVAGESNEYLVAEFGGKGGLRVLSGWTRDRAATTAALSRLAAAESKDAQPKPSGLTYWRDACAEALAQLASAAHARRALVLFGDGGADSGSRTGGDALTRRLREAAALFYVVAATAPARSFVQDAADLDKLARTAGGRAYFPVALRELDETVDRVALELSSQYLVGFVPANAAAPGRLNKVKVSLTKLPAVRGTIYVRSPEGYYTPVGK